MPLLHHEFSVAEEGGEYGGGQKSLPTRVWLRIHGFAVHGRGKRSDSLLRIGISSSGKWRYTRNDERGTAKP